MAKAILSRIVLGLPTGAPSLPVVTLAATIARWMGSQLEALLLLDSALDTLGALPFAREFQPLTMQWRELDRPRLLAERRLIESRLRRHAESMTEVIGVACLVQTVSGALAAELLKVATPADIIAIPAPGRCGEELLDPYPELIASISGSPFPVLILPHDPASRNGPIIALLSQGDLAAGALARDIAAAANAELVEIGDVKEIRALPHPDRQRSPRGAPAAESRRDARLIVASRSLLLDLSVRSLLDIVARTGAPLLLVG